MATIDLKNTGNIPSTFYLGVNDAQNAPTGYENFSSGSAISSALLSFTSTYQSVYNAVSTPTSTTWSSGGSGWTVAEVIEVPAGVSPLTMVRFQKQVNGQNYEFSLVGALTVDKNIFTIKGSTLIVDGPNGDAEIKLSTATTMTFEQKNSSKTYETQTSFYSGNINQASTVVGALPTGATLISINGDNKLPTSWTQIGSDTNTFALLTLQSSSNFTFNQNGTLTGAVTGMKTVNPVDSGPGFQINTYDISNGTLNSYLSPRLGLFNNNATLKLANQARTEGPIQVNFSTLIPDLPASGVSVATYTTPAVSMSTAIGLGDEVSFAGDDQFTIASSTDTFIHAGAGTDKVTGGAGNDIIYGGAGNDILNGGAGNDTFLVNQPDGAGNTITHSRVTTGTVTVLKHALGNDVIDGGSGLDTLSFAPKIEPSNTVNTKYVASTGPNVFTLSDQNGNQYLVSLPGLSKSQYQVQNTQINQYGVAAVELSGPSNSKQIYVVDTKTAEVFYHFTLGTGENFIKAWNNTSTTFFTETRTNNTLVLKSYDFGLDATNNVVSKSYTFPPGTNGWANDIITTSGGKQYLFYTESTGPVIYELNPSTGTATSLPNLLLPDADWIDHGFIKNNQLWFKVGFRNSDGSYNESFHSYNLTGTATVSPYSTQSSSDFWDAWRAFAYPDALYRVGNAVVDLAKFGTYVEVKGTAEISDELHLLQLSISPSANSGVDYERWVVLDNNGQIVADKSFNSSTGYNVRTLGDNEVHDGYLYFQQANATFTFSGGLVSNVTQGSTPTIYKVPLSAIPLLLTTTSNTLETQPYVQVVQPATQKSLYTNNTSELVVFQACVPISDVNGSNSTSNLIISESFSFGPNHGSTIKLTLVNTNNTQNTVYNSGLLSDGGFKDYAIHNGKIYLLLNDQNTGRYTQNTVVYDPLTNTVQTYPNSSQEFIAASVASQQAPEAYTSSISLSETLVPELSLVLPAAYYSSYSASTSLGTGSNYYKNATTGELGELQSGFGNTQEWTTWQAPADGSIAIGYKNSYTGAIEYSHLKDVEFLELNGPAGLETYDIRPLYLASKNSDTLYSFSRSGYESLNYVFDKASEPSGSGPFDDPMAWYRNQFSVYSRPSDGGQEWRYYLNGGDEKDTLYGRESTGENIPVSRLNFNNWGFTGSVTLAFTKVGVATPLLITISKSSDWATFNDEIAAKINQLNLGISAQRGTSTNEVLISGLLEAGWTVKLSDAASGVTLTTGTIQDLGRDTLDGGAGADTMRGYGGNDTYFVDNSADAVIESASSAQGFDTVLTSTNYNLDGNTGVERLMVHQIIQGANGNLFTEPRATTPALASATVNLTGNNFTYELIGHDGANTITAGALAGLTKSSVDNPNAGALLLGLGGNDTLIGGERNDHLFGGTGNDVLKGNAGDDSFYMGYLTASSVESITPTVNTIQGVAAVTESAAVTFFDLEANQSVTVGGRTYTATQATTAAELANAFASSSSTKGTFSGSLSGFTASSSVTNSNTLVFTSTAASSNVNNLYANSTSSTQPVVVITQGSAAVTEITTLTFKSMTAGQSITVNGLTYTSYGESTAAQVATAFSNKTSGSSYNNSSATGILTGSLSGFISGTTSSDTVTFTSASVGVNVADLDVNAELNLLPYEYVFWKNSGLDNQPKMLSGGNDTATGGDGFDTVVIATDNSGDFSPFYVQRISETQIKIYTVAETMTVDSTVEAIKYQSTTSSSPEIYLLPWAATLDATTRDKNFISSGFTYPLQYAAPSDYADLIDLNNYFPTQSDEIISSFDAGKGNDIVYGDSRFSTLRGGDGNDWIFSGIYPFTNDQWRYEMYGDAGNDTLTLSTQQMQGYMSSTNGKVLLDGGVGDDNYRVIIDNQNVNIRIEDSAGKDSLTLYAQNHSDVFDLDVMWDAGELRVISYTQNGNSVTRNIVAAANADTLENLYFAPYAEEQNWYSTTAIGGNLVKPTATTYATGKMAGTAGNDVLLALPSVRQDYDGGAGDDVILVGNVSGNIISGGAGNNIINQSTYVDFISTGPIRNSISYAWATTGTGEIDLQSGLGYISSGTGTLLGSDRWEGGLFTDVIGGAANERIKGSDVGNKLDGGAGNDIIYSGGNQAGYTPDQLIGGAGNDILIDESHWFNQSYWSAHNQTQLGQLQSLQGLPGSSMEGGAGNDVYVLQHNGTVPSSFPIVSSNSFSFPVAVTPTRIIERDATGKDTGGSDTIRFITSGDGLKPYKFAQKGNVVQIQLDTADTQVGDILMVSFLSGTTANNAYTIEKVTLGTGADAGTSIVEFTASTSATLSGNVLVDHLGGFSPVVDWVDSNTLAVFSSGDISSHVLNDVANGAPTIQSYDSSTGQVVSNMPVQALIDKNAMEFFDFGSADPEQAGFVVPISYNIGKSSSVEMIISGGPGPATLFGGEGTDLIIDTPYDDVLIGGNGNDIISSQIGFDIVDAGAGNDTLTFRSDNQVLIGGQGADQFVITGIGNHGGALIADFKPWEGDDLKLDSNWLESFMSGESRPGELSYDDVSFNVAEYSLGLNSRELVITAEFSFGTGNNNIGFDVLRIQYNSDRDKAWDQVDLAMHQLVESAQDTAHDIPRWTVTDLSHMT